MKHNTWSFSKISKFLKRVSLCGDPFFEKDDPFHDTTLELPMIVSTSALVAMLIIFFNNPWGHGFRIIICSSYLSQLPVTISLKTERIFILPC
ncbi:MAG: hypothetical protein ABWK15_09025 [Dissulfuribacterales bacterium]